MIFLYSALFDATASGLHYFNILDVISTLIHATGVLISQMNIDLTGKELFSPPLSKSENLMRYILSRLFCYES